jgi:hypothetical protein
MKGMIKLECPLCRAPIINLPKKISNQIKSNGKNYAEEVEEENRQALINELGSESIFPEMEVLLALRFLAEADVPLQFLPSTISVNYSLRPRAGELFSMMVNLVAQEIDLALDGEDTGVDEDIDDFDFQDDEFNIIRIIASSSDASPIRTISFTMDDLPPL